MLTVSKKARTLAKERNQATFSLMIDGSSKNPQGDEIEISGPISSDLEKELWAFADKYIESK